MSELVFKLNDIAEVNLRATTEDDKHLPAYDHTALNAVATCPQWGILRYVHGKAFSQRGRAMALEAGSAAHDVYAAARLWELRKRGLMRHAEWHGHRVLSPERYEDMCLAVDSKEDERNQMLNFCLAALASSGFYDDPSDKYRTMTHMEESCIAYLDRLPHARYPVWVEDDDDPSALVGIEIPIDIVIEFGDMRFRFIGRADGLHVSQDGKALILGENKTASRLGDAWAMSFRLSHQVTGYCIGLSTMLGQPVERAMVHGMSIPLPRSYDYGGLMTEHVTRPPASWPQFLEWFLHCAQIVHMWTDDVANAPKYTHSCNRYFRPCAFVPFCDAPVDERQSIYDEMVDDMWSPLDDEGSAN